jgi:hypothetical protein
VHFWGTGTSTCFQVFLNQRWVRFYRLCRCIEKQRFLRTLNDIQVLEEQAINSAERFCRTTRHEHLRPCYVELR